MRLLDGQLVLSPTDLTKFTRCAHTTTLDLGRLRKTLEPLAGPQKSLHSEFLGEKGTEHELDYVERLARAGNRVIRIQGERRTAEDLRNAAQATIDAIRSGAADYINQAVFFDGKWVGYADLLERVSEGRYEVVDLKLARSAKAEVLLQLAAYSEQLTRIQGARPEKMHIILGTKERATFRFADFEAYYRRIKSRYEDVMNGSPPKTLPYVVDFCALCEWNMHCWRHLEQLDHLVRVANIRRVDVRRLEDGNIKTLTKLGDTPVATIDKMRADTYAALHQQARLQKSEYTRTKRHRFELLPPEAERGFARLPRPSAGDLFLDLEADPYAGADGVTYLFGIAYVEDRQSCLSGSPVLHYKSWWAHDALHEKQAFEDVVDFIVARRREHPDLHIYHYTAAEPSAFKRMSGEYGTRENEIDDFLRGGVFVDLYAVVKQAMRISQPSYSLKKVEAFYFNREEEGVFEAGGPILAYEEWLETQDPAMLKSIENYNREDCLSTLELLKWLLAIRGMDPPWMEAPAEETEEELPDELAQAVMQRSELLANLLQYYRREARPAWWWYFDRLKMSPDELKDDHESIGGLELAKDIAPRQEKRSTIYTFRFPAQEHKLSDKDAVDPATKKHVTIVSIDDANGLLEIKRGNNSKEPMPVSLIPGGPLETKKQREAIRRFAKSFLECGGSPPLYKAALDILERKPIEGSSYLFIQGPPGSGKTRRGGRDIAALLKEGKRIGVASNSHKAIHNLLDEVVRQGVPFKGLKKCSDDNPESEYQGNYFKNSSDIDDFVDPSVRLIAGTSWLFADPRLDQTLDYVFIDEAGQVALANALVIAMSARRVVLLGDPLQLAQVSQAVHPGNSGRSVLEHLLGDDVTIPPDRGEFLEHTFRMHPDVCRFVSEVVYDGRLESAAECTNRNTSSGTGLRFIPIDHEGNSQSSAEEAGAHRRRDREAARWRDRNG